MPNPGQKRSASEAANDPAPADTSQVATIDGRPHKRQRALDEADLRAVAVAKRKRLAKKFDQVDTNANKDVSDKYFPLREIPSDELEHSEHPPSHVYPIDNEHQDVNFYSVQNAQTGRIVGKVDVTDREAMLAMVDTLMGLAKKHGGHVGTFTFDIRSIDRDKSTEAYKAIQARNTAVPTLAGQHTELVPLGQQHKQAPQQPDQEEPHQQEPQQDEQVEQDPFRDDPSRYKLVEYHKSGGFDDWRDTSAWYGHGLYYGSDNENDGQDKRDNVSVKSLRDMILMWAKQAGLLVQRTVHGSVREHLALPDEVPAPASPQIIGIGNLSVGYRKEVLMNPGTWVEADLPGTVIGDVANEQPQARRYLMFKTTTEFNNLVKQYGRLVWRVKRVVNEYRLGIFPFPAQFPGERMDDVEILLLSMLSHSQVQRTVERAGQ